MININVSNPNDGLGDKLRDAFNIVNSNFQELIDLINNGVQTTVSISDVIGLQSSLDELSDNINVLDQSLSDLSISTSNDIQTLTNAIDLHTIDINYNTDSLNTINDNINAINDNINAINASLITINNNISIIQSTISGVLAKVSTAAPISSTDIGSLGDIRVTPTYIYTCIATNTWVRGNMSSW